MFNQVASDIVGQLTCIEERLAAIQRLLSYEYGQPIREIAGHDPRRLPLVGRIQLAAGQSQEIDIAPMLGKPATRGHLVNLGTQPATLHFMTSQVRAELNDQVGPYILMPGTTLDLSFIVERFRVTAGANPADVQFFLQ